MLYGVRWTQQGESDLENILSWYAQEAGLRVAQAIYTRVREQVGSLAQFPQRCRPGRVAGTREYVITRLPFIAVVHVDADTVYVLNLVHTARKYPPIPTNQA
jgi:toxin ParE1/3/4